MNEDFIKYFELIGLKGAFRDRANEIIDFYESLYPGEIKTIFISNYIDNEGNRYFEDLWLFTDRHMLEAKQFLTRDDFDSATIQNSVQYWQINKENYHFKNATPKSRMTIHLGLKVPITGDLKASSENCDFLRDIFLKHVIPNEI